MISNINLKNFKKFLDQSFEIRPLTVLCGNNSAGKSSVIQSLLLLRQTAQTRHPHNFISLNGPFGLQLGAIEDILCNDGIGTMITLSATDSDMGVFNVNINADPNHAGDHFFSIPSNSGVFPSCLTSDEAFAFTYLCAERQGPRDIQLSHPKPQRLIEIGANGEFSADVLLNYETVKIRTSLLHPKTDATNQLFRQQVELWMGEWAPNLQIRVESQASGRVATISFKQRSVRSEWIRPPNVGFGISYSLPIVLAGLLAPSDSIFIVDNPESHLHPAGQSAMGCFLGTLAAAGVRVIVETHSDHILNGIRLAAIRKEHLLKYNDIVLYNFEFNGIESDIQKINLTRTGGLSSWPKGFFDQAELDLGCISKINRYDI